MGIPKRGERGFTLIELLIVIAILGVLAAVVIPNVGRFIGRGETESKNTELANIQSAVLACMVDNTLSTLPTPTTNSTNDMFVFPDTTVLGVTTSTKWKDPDGDVYSAGDNIGYVLYQHDVVADADNATLVNYAATRTTAYYYSCDAQGSVLQHTAADHPHSDGGE
ncbi:type II secretion system protein [Chloroflexota bacterium]